MEKWVFISYVLFSLLCYTYSEDLFTIKSSVSPLNERNYAKQIVAQRIRDVNIIFFYRTVSNILAKLAIFL